MFSVTRYCVQPYEFMGEFLVPADATQHREREDAVRAAELMLRRVAGVSVYEVRGWPAYDAWGKPRLLVSYGRVLDVGEPRRLRACLDRMRRQGKRDNDDGAAVTR